MVRLCGFPNRKPEGRSVGSNFLQHREVTEQSRSPIWRPLNKIQIRTTRRQTCLTKETKTPKCNCKDTFASLFAPFFISERYDSEENGHTITSSQPCFPSLLSSCSDQFLALLGRRLFRRVFNTKLGPSYSNHQEHG